MRNKEPDVELDRLAHNVIGAASEGHRLLGPGFLELGYEGALCVELDLRDIAFVRQYPVAVNYKGFSVGDSRLDLLVDSRLVVELKAVEALLPLHTAQVISYLKTTGCSLGLLINFNVSVLKQGIRRIILSK
jgi:GxxExxY protein